LWILEPDAFERPPGLLRDGGGPGVLPLGRLGESAFSSSHGGDPAAGRAGLVLCPDPSPSTSCVSAARQLRGLRGLDFLLARGTPADRPPLPAAARPTDDSSAFLPLDSTALLRGRNRDRLEHVFRRPLERGDRLVGGDSGSAGLLFLEKDYRAL